MLEASEDDEDKQLTIGQLKYKYKKYVSAHFREHPYTNKDTGWKIRISNNGVREIEKFRTRDHIISLKVLDIILENAKFVETVPDNKNTPGIENVAYFSYKAKLNNELHFINLTVKKHLDDDERMYYYHKEVCIRAKK